VGYFQRVIVEFCKQDRNKLGESGRGLSGRKPGKGPEEETFCRRTGEGQQVLLYEPVLHVVLYEPRIPQNTGSVARTCVAACAKLWLVRPLGFHLDDRHLRRAGLDYWPYLVWEVVDDWQHVRERLGSHRFWYFEKQGARLYTEAAYQRGDALVFGSETYGLPERILREAGEATLRLPQSPWVRSLNLANAASIAIYEALRQIHGWPAPRDHCGQGQTSTKPTS
jgi:tRNA (cytidine/uridine-2'-O-)-methyltransferase